MKTRCEVITDNTVEKITIMDYESGIALTHYDKAFHKTDRILFSYKEANKIVEFIKQQRKPIVVL